MGKRNACKILARKFEWERRIRRPGCKCEDDVKMDREEIGCKDVDYIHLAQNRIQWQSPCEQCNEPLVT
jgi:hypothetical protein